MTKITPKMLLRSKKLLATPEQPFILCTTCGTATNKVIQRVSSTLRRVKAKTWKRTIKPHDNKLSLYNGQKVKAKTIYFSYFMAECIKKKHKLSVRKKPFSTKLVTNVI